MPLKSTNAIQKILLPLGFLSNWHTVTNEFIDLPLKGTNAILKKSLICGISHAKANELIDVPLKGKIAFLLKVLLLEGFVLRTKEA